VQRALPPPSAKLTPPAVDQAGARAVDERELTQLEHDLLVPRGHHRLKRGRKSRSADEVELAAKDEHDRGPIYPHLDREDLCVSETRGCFSA
jgi:hypothetical protein